MTKYVHDLGFGLGPIPTREVSREELEKMYPPVTQTVPDDEQDSESPEEAS